MQAGVSRFVLVFAASLSLVFSGCGGSSSSGTQPPPPATYTIGGTVSGLSGSGLILQNDGGNNLSITADGAFTFSAAVNSGSAYSVTVYSQPSSPAQVCTFTNGSGIATGNVTNIQVDCAAPQYTIGGSVLGLSGTGLVLQLNSGNNLAIASNGLFTFSTTIASGITYSVTVYTQPSNPAQVCTVTNGSGTATGNVTNVQIYCETPAVSTIGGTVSGLSGTGLVLQLNSAFNLSIASNGPFIFSTTITSGNTYSVTVYSQPSSPAQVCTVTNGSGIATGNVTNVQITCGAPPQYTIGGTVSGLSGSGLVLQNNGGNNLAITANGAFTFSASVTSGSTYSVTVFNQPSSPTQLCSVINSSGTASANVSNVQVACYVVTTAAGEWTWMGGSLATDQPGIYGTLGVPSASNSPGARMWSCSWTDLSGNLWLFGGYGWGSAVAQGSFNDLWEYSNRKWAWMGGSNQAIGSGNPIQPGVYGTMGVPAPGNQPGARYSATCWTDSQGNFWLYGGQGFDSTGANGPMGDLWRYSKGEWTWMAGSEIAASFITGSAWQGQAVYGTEGVPSPSNTPGVRQMASGWADSEGNLWLYGGVGSAGTMSDLWEYSNGLWTWMGGSDVADINGIYGTEGTPAPANVPMARYGATAWTDAQGDFWLFGGDEWLNDLWRYANGEWTWMSGSDAGYAAGFYGLEYVAAPGNFPGAREDSVGWTDAQGNFWLFGGEGLDYHVSPYGLGEVYGDLNDLWEYANGEWTWMSGSNLACATASNGPSPREGAASWTDKSGNLWLFGGGMVVGCLAPSTTKLNDLWVFQPWGPSGPPPPPPPAVTYTVGGTAYGLAGSGLVLQDNLADNLAVSSNGSSTFPTALAANENYSITVLTQPSNPQQYCILVNAVGTANANVTNVQVMCTTVAGGHNQWTWMGGNAPASYGTLGQAAASNLPPVRSDAATWTDTSGNVWLFGGNSSVIGNVTNVIGPCGPSPDTYFDYNDLWKYSGGEWTWMGGSQSATSTQPGVYGTQGQPSPTNFPGARHDAVTWTDLQGNFWLFGGIGIDSAGNQGDLNDLWEYSNGQWTWVAGSNLYGQSGSYGTQGTPAAANTPGARDGAVGRIDAAGNFWLFGGHGYDSTTTTCEGNLMPAGYLNDLWKFANGQWIWVGGSNVANQSGSYGTQDVASANNVPGARAYAMAWTDPSGDFWLFGGATSEGFNDLWKYANGQWTWVAGSNTGNQAGVYGILGVPAASNTPGARIAAAGWIDASGNMWLFGGAGLDALGGEGLLNDLWRFTSGQWTWVGGPDLRGNPGSYGVLGVPAPTNLPRGRIGASAWTQSGTFWLFGGGFNDLWEYQP